MCHLFSDLFDVLIKHKVINIVVFLIIIHVHKLYSHTTNTQTSFPTQVRMKPNYVSVFVAVMVIEGLGRSLDPDLDLFEAATPCLLQRAKMDVTARLIGT